MTPITRALILAAQIHDGQVDKAGLPYILHPLAVATPFILALDETLAVSALLHDVIEDHPDKITLQEIADMFGETVSTIVDFVSRRPNETYREFIYRVAKHDLARKLKLKDVAHNMHPDRIRSIPESLQDRYVWAEDVLVKADKK